MLTKTLINKILIALVTFALAFLITQHQLCFCEKELLSEEFKKAMQEFEKAKAKEERAIEKRLVGKLEAIINHWIVSASAENDRKINKLIEQDWKPRFDPYIQHKHYLRNYAYLDRTRDIEKTESKSILVPYEGSLSIKEVLYLERAPLANVPRSKYYFTVTKPTKITFEYQEDKNKWTIVDMEYGESTIEKGWPQEVIEKTELYFIPR